jgi:hypothetical protein
MPGGAHKRGARWASLSLEKPRLTDLLAKMCERKDELHKTQKISKAFSNPLRSKLVSYTTTVLSNLVNKANFVHNLFLVYSIYQSLLVSGDYVPIIRRNNCVYATLGICYSVWVIVWYAYQTITHTEHVPSVP